MKEYKIQLNEDLCLTVDDGEETNEIGLALKVWQDLNRLAITAENAQTLPMHQEDVLIKNILEQLLEKEFNGVGNIPIPESYTYHERHEE